MTDPVPTAHLIDCLVDARARTLELVHGLNADQLKGPKLSIVNPLLWEIGHLAWFHEHFALRTLGDTTQRLDAADALYNSSTVPHDIRWDLPLPTLLGTLDYLARVQDAMVNRLNGGAASAEEAYLYLLTTYHEDMHGEAFTYSRQTLGYPAPDFATLLAGPPTDIGAGPLDGDVAVPGGEFLLGAAPSLRFPRSFGSPEPCATPPGAEFVFDNEKWAHPVTIEPFRIARAPVTNAQFLEFVADDGYRRSTLWSDAGWRWREAAGAEHPHYWIKQQASWSERQFDRTIGLRPHRPVIHVNWYEAEAWCNWAGRRLPHEAEWEAAAATEPGAGGFAPRKRRYPWGDTVPGPRHANLDGRVLGTVDVAAHPEGDSAWGCRQMLGNVWEWTAAPFAPYPGFAPDIYEDYSAPWFGSRKILRGGAWATRDRMITNTYRNFFTPERRDIMAGFRTCALTDSHHRA